MGWGGLQNGNICVAASAEKRSTFLVDDIERKWICSGTQSHSVFCYQYSINCTERYLTKYTRSVKVQITSGIDDVSDVICTLLLCKY